MPRLAEIGRKLRSGGRARWIVAALTIAVVGALIYLAIEKLDPAQVGHLLAKTNVGWALLALALMGLAFVARGESWYAVLRAALPDTHLGRGVVMRGIMIGMIGSTVAPGRLGEAARALVVARRLGDPSRNIALVVGTVVSQTLINLLALGILALVTLLGAALSGARADAIIGVVAVPAVIVAVVLLGPRALERASLSKIGWLRRGAARIAHQLTNFRRGMVVFKRPWAAIHAGGMQLIAWALQLFACYSVILSLGLQHQANLIAAAAVLLAVNVTAIVPVTPSNVGVFQAACIAVLAPFGVSASQGLAYGLILQAVEIVAAVALGVPALLREGLSVSELRREAREAETFEEEAGDAETPGGTGEHSPKVRGPEQQAHKAKPSYEQ
jgi:phosphatidyl-myo-inositol alpha-mannosyltransferase